MQTITTSTPDGVVWRVRVVWQPRWRRLARRFGGWRRTRRNSKGGDGINVDLPTGGGHGGGEHHGGGGGGGGVGFLDNLGDDIVGAIVVIICLVLFAAVFWWVLLPLLLVVVDMVAVVVLLAVAIPARVLLRRPWTVEAATATSHTGDSDGEEHCFATEVVGWRRALRTRDEIAEKLHLGHPAPVVGTLQQRT